MKIPIYKCFFVLLFFNDVAGEIALYRMKRALQMCQIHTENETIHEDNGRTVWTMTSQTCDFEVPGVSCVFEAEHPKTSGIGVTHQKHGCGECPFNHGHLPCSLVRSPLRNELKTVCCCKTPACLTTIYKDFEIGWNTSKGSLCAVGDYDNFRNPRWKDGIREEKRWNSSTTCFIGMRRARKKDSRSQRERSHMMLELGCGCPFRFESEGTKVSVRKDVVYHCCKGANCNRELYRMIGFEWIQNTVLREDEQEFFERIEYEKKRFAQRKYVGNNDYIHPKAVFDAFRTYWTILTAMVVLFVLIYCNPRRMEQRPYARIPLAKKNEEVERDDDDLVFGEF